MPRKRTKPREIPQQDRRPTRRPGRPTLFEAPIINKLLRNIRLGMNYTDACAGAGLSYDTFCAWRRTAENRLNEFAITLPVRGVSFDIPAELADDPYVQFLHKVHETTYEALAEDLNVIRLCARGTPVKDKTGAIIFYKDADWRAAQARIQMRFPQYNKQVREISGPEGKPIQTQQVPTDPVLIAQKAYKKARDAGRSHDDIVANLLALGIEERDLEGLE